MFRRATVPVKVPLAVLVAQVPPPDAMVAGMRPRCCAERNGLAQLIEKVPANTPPGAI